MHTSPGFYGMCTPDNFTIPMDAPIVLRSWVYERWCSMMRDIDLQGLPDDIIPAASSASASPRSRRDVVRAGIKLAFIAPVISTFFAQDAMAYVQSCYPAGQACGGATLEPCCNGLNCVGNVCT